MPMLLQNAEAGYLQPPVQQAVLHHDRRDIGTFNVLFADHVGADGRNAVIQYLPLLLQ